MGGSAGLVAGAVRTQPHFIGGWRYRGVQEAAQGSVLAAAATGLREADPYAPPGAATNNRTGRKYHSAHPRRALKHDKAVKHLAAVLARGSSAHASASAASAAGGVSGAVDGWKVVCDQCLASGKTQAAATFTLSALAEHAGRVHRGKQAPVKLQASFREGAQPAPSKRGAAHKARGSKKRHRGRGGAQPMQHDTGLQVPLVSLADSPMW